MASVLREGDPLHIEPPIAWAGLALVHKAQHEIAAVFEIDPKELLEVKDRAMSSLKQVFLQTLISLLVLMSQFEWNMENFLQNKGEDSVMCS